MASGSCWFRRVRTRSFALLCLSVGSQYLRLLRDFFHMHFPGLLTTQTAVDERHDEQRGEGGDDEAADDGAAERGVLFAALAEAERHGQHADDHGEGSHEDGAEARGSG